MHQHDLAQGEGVTQADHFAVTQFLYREARLLDDCHLDDWLGLLTQDIRYRLLIPNCLAAEANGDVGTQYTCIMDETYSSLSTRVRQLMTPSYTIAENPRSLMRRFVSNVLVDDCDDDGEIHVVSNALIYRSRPSQGQPHLFSTVRRDVFRYADRKLWLSRRESILDESIVTSRNVSSIF